MCSREIEWSWLWTLFLDLFLWVLTDSKIAGNCFHLFISKGTIRGDIQSNTQSLDLWFWAHGYCFTNRSWSRYMCQIILLQITIDDPISFISLNLFYCLKEVGLVIVFYMETLVSNVVQKTHQIHSLLLVKMEKKSLSLILNNKLIIPAVRKFNLAKFKS